MTISKNGVIIGRPKKSKNIVSTCEQCKQEYSRPDYAKTGLKYCSLECSHLGRTGKPRPARKVQQTSVNCLHCGNVFLTGGRTGKRYGAKYCSAKCHGVGQSTQPSVRDMSSEEIAWLAGLFDGEGNIAWPRKNNAHTARLTITSTCFELLDKIKSVTGTGSIVGLKRLASELHSPCANWCCYGDRAKKLLELMLPWLIVKKENAEIVLEAAAANDLGLSAPRQPIPSNRTLLAK